MHEMIYSLDIYSVYRPHIGRICLIFKTDEISNNIAPITLRGFDSRSSLENMVSVKRKVYVISKTVLASFADCETCNIRE